MEIRDVLRLEEGKVYLPLLFLEKVDKIVILIGMFHMASPRFLEDIARRLSSYERLGFQVMYEVINPSLSSSSKGADMLERAYGEIKEELRKFGFGFQEDIVLLKSGWKSADDSTKSRRAFKVAKDAQEGLIGDPDTFVDRFFAKFTDYESILTSKKARELVGNRDKIAALKILKEAEGKNVVSYWGAAHLPGISNILQENGFVLVRTEWVLVLDRAELKTVSR